MEETHPVIIRELMLNDFRFEAFKFNSFFIGQLLGGIKTDIAFHLRGVKIYIELPLRWPPHKLLQRRILRNHIFNSLFKLGLELFSVMAASW